MAIECKIQGLDHDTLRSSIPSVLAECTDPAKFVLEAILEVLLVLGLCVDSRERDSGGGGLGHL
ncbi:Frigida domain-containing protein [Cephalotus follicularis]|uniref:Frigida domain-containing protein n=1 Tax=Cephalotus follicularis TaxID=3775 RepID=A0A1Q3CK50_CEPFO|nr:Frigida domain-containing protein [Cephalotus follicularis]